MTPADILEMVQGTEMYNLHSHTQYCDGRATLSEMAAAAADAGFRVWGITPHSPLPPLAQCQANMSADDVQKYLDDAERTKALYDGRMKVLTGMEVDFIDADWGPHIDRFQRMPLDYRIGSVHFVPTQQGFPMDCDGSAERFLRYLKDAFEGDLRYVVEKYFEQVLTMLERGGFEILGHCDKIAGNASAADPEIEHRSWYRSLMEDVISHAASAGVLLEINTKALESRKRFYPSPSWWPMIKTAGIPMVVNSDAHYTDKINAGRPQALKLLKKFPT